MCIHAVEREREESVVGIYITLEKNDVRGYFSRA